MKKNVAKSFLALFIATLLVVSGCAAKPLTLSQDDSGKVLNLKVGQKIVIDLESNPTTGYDWEIANLPDNLKAEGTTYSQKNADKKVVGSGGIKVFNFTVISKGKGNLILQYKRSWEKAETSSKEFHITVNSR